MKQFLISSILILISIFLVSCQQNLTAKHTLEEVLPDIEYFIEQDVTHESTLPLFEGTMISYEINNQMIDDLKNLDRPIYDQYMDIEVIIYARDDTYKMVEQVYVLSAYSPKHNYEIHLNGVDFENIQKESFSPTIVSLYQNDTELFESLGNIRGRGNSNWFAYDKKSYRISFDHDIEMMGLKPHHDYLLIGMAADKSLMRDVIAHQLSQMLSLEITQDTRYISLHVNGDYHGLYALIEDRTYIKSTEDPLTFALELDHRIDWEPSNDVYIRVDGAPYAIKRSANLDSQTLDTIERYLENLKDVQELILPDDSIKPNWLALPLQTDRRLELLNYLEDSNIQTRVTFAGNVTRHPVYREYLQDFENADTVMKNGFLLGANHGMTLEDVDYVCSKIKEFFKK